jgi:anti-sigma factor RsiW
VENSSNHIECAWAEEALERYLDRELSPEELARLERHWLECSECEEAHELAEHVQATLRALPRLRCPEHVMERAVASHARPLVRRWSTWTAVGGAVAAASIVTLIALQSPSIGPVEIPPPTPPVVDVQEDGREIAEQARVVLAYVGGVGLSTRDAVRREAIAPAVEELSNTLDTVLGQVLPDTTTNEQ